MISVGKSYKVLSIKEGTTKKGDRWVSLGVGNSEFDNETKEWISKGFVNIFATTNNYYAKGDKVEVKEITGIDTKEYNGKTYVTMFAKVGEQEVSNNYETIESGDLPF